LYKNNAIVILLFLVVIFALLMTLLKLTVSDEAFSEEPEISVAESDEPDIPPTSQRTRVTYLHRELVEELLEAQLYVPAVVEPKVVLPYEPEIDLDTEFVPYVAYVKYGKTYKLPISAEWQAVVYKYARMYEVPYNVALAISGVETSFDVFRGFVKSRSGSVVYYGCGMVSTVSREKISAAIGQDMCTPEGGVAAMCYVFGKKYKEFGGNVTYALMAYNMGSGGARAKIALGITSSKYAEKVIHISQGFIKEGEE